MIAFSANVRSVPDGIGIGRSVTKQSAHCHKLSLVMKFMRGNMSEEAQH